MHLSKYVSKSDSNLISYPPNEQKARRKWNEPTADSKSSRENSERAPSFTSEWEEIDKIMSSIDAGITTGLEEINDGVARMIPMWKLCLQSQSASGMVSHWLDSHPAYR
uniref:Ankyrin repeat and sterile alpha motif domain-containing protein 1B n=1 Tax=Sphaerodactylus townsendi TaxID=933632 RepID=A0ACB8FNF8_9SAUR